MGRWWYSRSQPQHGLRAIKRRQSRLRRQHHRLGKTIERAIEAVTGTRFHGPTRLDSIEIRKICRRVRCKRESLSASTMGELKGMMLHELASAK